MMLTGASVNTSDGLVAVEKIELNQLVWAEDPETGERALKRIVCLFRNEKYELVHLQIKGETITTTVGHPFFVQGKGWVVAKDLQASDRLELLDGGEAYIDSVNLESLDEPVKVYNFEVEDFHTYFVGSHSILVHNVCARREGVRKAWQQEKAAVQNGTSKYNWTKAQKQELLSTGRIRGYQGHHIKSVKAYPNLAADPNNIYFCTPSEHLWQHFGNWKNATHALRVK